MEENLEKEVKKVLIVDDEQAIIDVLVYNLKKVGTQMHMHIHTLTDIGA